jgi:uncharacterized protein YjbI with pentapeptide repeats
LDDTSLDRFECQAEEYFRSACYGNADYVHQGKRCCILHFPSQDKKADEFQEALRKKRESQDCNFAGVYFPSSAIDFSGAAFKEEANFFLATFEGRASFSVPAMYAGFVSATFEGIADFSSVLFKEKASFRDVGFKGETTFSKNSIVGMFPPPRRPPSEAIFEEEEAEFFMATFEGNTDFAGAIFKGEAEFAAATFEAGANFAKTTFERKADFDEITFEVEARFNEAAFEGKVDFSRATLKKDTAFYMATFTKEVRFWRLTTVSSTVLNFRSAVIEKPERFSFHSTYLRPSWFVDLDAQELDFSDVTWFRLPNGEEPKDGKRLRLEDEIETLKSQGIEPPISLNKLAETCRRLMNKAEDNRDYSTANELHYWSMEARRKEGWRRLGLIATLYWALSGYGERPRRALLVLVSIWLAFAVLYYLLVPSSPFWVFSASDIWQGIDYGRQAMVYSLSTLARLNPRPQSAELDWFQTLVTVEGILGPLQIALFLLTVRRTVMR